MNNQELMEFVSSIGGSVKETILNLTPEEIEDIYVHQDMHTLHIGETTDDPFMAIGLEAERLTVVAIERTFSDVLFNRFKEMGEIERERMQSEMIGVIDRRLTELDINHNHQITIHFPRFIRTGLANDAIIEIYMVRDVTKDHANGFNWAEPNDVLLTEILEKIIGALLIGVEYLKDFFYELHLSQSK